MSTKIPAFLEGNSLVHFSESRNQLFAGNSGGLIKIFNPDDLDSEPVSVDIPENITSLHSHGNKVLVTTTEGHLALLEFGEEVTGDENFTVLHQADKPLRDAAFINEGKRLVCGGDSLELLVFDLSNDNSLTKITLPDPCVGISYNSVGELVTLSLCNGELHVFSVINETPKLVEKIPRVLPSKINTSSGTVDYDDEHAHELVCTRSLWTNNGERIYVPTASNTIKAMERSDWSSAVELALEDDNLVAFTFSPNNKYIASLSKSGSVKIFSLASSSVSQSYNLSNLTSVATDLAWTKRTLFVGANNGELFSLPVDLRDITDGPSRTNTISEVDSLFLDEEADESDDAAANQENGHKKRTTLDDSMIIDEDDDEEEMDENYNTGVDYYLQSSRKKAKISNEGPLGTTSVANVEIVPYSPGSTPWIKSVNSSTSATKRRYLFMSAIGYVWSVKNASVDASDDQKSITLSFFDRTVNKDYHFIDYYDYDLCSLNERGVVLGCSGYKSEGGSHKGRIFYRHHVNTSDSWDRQIPLLENEYISSICITSSTSEGSGDSIIVVGTNLGYLRFFNLYGLCINLMKVSPVITLISSAFNTVFSIHQKGPENYTYSIINVPEDYKFYQQDCSLPLKPTNGPLIKGLFFNDIADPCIVAAYDDTLTVLSHWREPNNARWVPVLNCKDAVSDHGLSESKRNWKSWPLGLQDDKLVNLILKNNDHYPGFPLPLPVELDLKLPVKCWKSLENKADEDGEILTTEAKLEIIKEADPEEEFLRATTFGKLLASSLADVQEEEEYMETLKNYSLVFDKSLLKLFNSACQESRLNKAFSIVKLIKNDKALLAATKIAERHNFNNLMTKISKLREDMLESEDEGEED